MMDTLPEIGPAPMPAVARILSRFDRPQLEAFLSVAIDLLDVIDGDGDERDIAWIEWTSLQSARRHGPNIADVHEDNEEDDAPEEDDPSGQCDEDEINTACPLNDGPGCPCSDPAEFSRQPVG